MRTANAYTTEFTQAEIDRLVQLTPRGRDNAMPAWKLAYLVGEPVDCDGNGLGSENTSPTFRRMVREANRRGIAICSCSKGFFMAETRFEVDAYMESLERRMVALAERVNDLRGCYV